MRKLLITATVFAMFGVVSANAQPTDYREVIKTCGAEWKASDARRSVQKGEGAKAWQDFRRECVAKSGYVAKAKRASTAKAASKAD